MCRQRPARRPRPPLADRGDDRPPIRFTRELLLSRQFVNITPMSQPTLNVGMGLKLNRRTFKAKRSALLAHRSTRKRRTTKIQHLPTVMNLNCRSICYKRDELTQLLDDSKADIVVLTETWLTRDNELIITNDIRSNNPDYEVISARRTKSGIDRSGVMILVNKQFSPSSTVISTTTTDDDSSGLLEALVIQTHQTRRSREFTSCLVAGVHSAGIRVQQQGGAQVPQWPAQ